MCWEASGRKDVTDERLGGIKADLSTHYEDSTYNGSVSFDIEHDQTDSSKFILKNFKKIYVNIYNNICETTPTGGDNIVMDFQYVASNSMSGRVIATIPYETTDHSDYDRKAHAIRFILYSNRLTYKLGYSQEEDVLELTADPNIPVVVQYQGQASQ